ncbi:protein kinase [Rhodococcus erythropolis]|uniref:protein kinase domain-containing protein n=1 Tax=Rhodococcus erythropolis TaxID=1833 RepID=UPI001E4D11C0|nr:MULTISPECIES: protein kinase [Rhodococcus erythropolis group]MCD2104914.1 protein kinase [Rhodococcus qingshengii]MCZ4526425.1 protein kinase [Rhodococcus erythropolis]
MQRETKLRFKTPPRVSGWTTHGKLVENKYIWHVTQGERKAVLKASLKVQQNRVDGVHQPNRFVDEIAIIRKLTDAGALGILPVLDYDKNEYPWWYVTPLAVPLAQHLEHKDFREVVASVTQLAEFLDDLHRVHGVFHRDIKPDNLFWYNNDPVFGDFEIATHAEKSYETGFMNKVGAFAYMAPEAGVAGSVTNWGPADVYSLAKTMWSLAAPRNQVSELQFPPLGHHQSLYPGYGLQYLTDSRAASLNGLMESASDLNPSMRPTLAEFAAELRSWLAQNQSLNDATAVPPGSRGFAYLVRAVSEWDRSASEFIVALIQEAHRTLGVVFVDVGTMENRPHEILDPYTGQSRSSAVMTLESDNDDEDFSDHTAVVMYPHSRKLRIVIGAQISRMDEDTPIFTELHSCNDDGSWHVIRSDSDIAASTRWPSIHSVINSYLSDYQAECIRRGVPEQTQWTAFRVL